MPKRFSDWDLRRNHLKYPQHWHESRYLRVPLDSSSTEQEEMTWNIRG